MPYGQISAHFQVRTGELKGYFATDNTNGIGVVLCPVEQGSYPNSINLGSKGVVPVAILTAYTYSGLLITGNDSVRIVQPKQ